MVKRVRLVSDGAATAEAMRDWRGPPSEHGRLAFKARALVRALAVRLLRGIDAAERGDAAAAEGEALAADALYALAGTATGDVLLAAGGG